MIDKWIAALREDWIRAAEEERRLKRLLWAIIIAMPVAQIALLLWYALR